MNRMLKTLLALTASAILWTGQANAVLIEIDASAAQGVSSGDTFTIDIWARDLGDEVIAAYDLDVLYDSVLLIADDVVFGLLLGDEFFFEAFNDFDLLVAGIVDAAQLSLLSDADLWLLQGGLDFILFSITFTVDPASEVVNVDFDFSLDYDEFNDVKCRNNEVCAPASVPEPGTLSLLGLGLLALGVSRRRRKLL